MLKDGVGECVFAESAEFTRKHNEQKLHDKLELAATEIRPGILELQKYSKRDDYLQTGLDNNEVLASTLKNGSNKFSKPKKKSEIQIFFTKFVQPFNLLLLIASLLSVVLFVLDGEKSNLYLSIFIFVISILNTLLEYFQERKTAAILESFQKLVPTECLVMRNNNYVKIFADEIVEGDIIYLKMGDKVGADIKLIESKDLKIDESSLTGESEPILKRASKHNALQALMPENASGDEKTNQSYKNIDLLSHKNMSNTSQNEIKGLNSCTSSLGDDQGIADRKEVNVHEDMVYGGNFVVNGEGKGIVVSIGDNTVLGQIAHLAVNKKTGKSEIAEEIDKYVKILSLVALFTSIVFYYISIKNGFVLRENLIFCVGIVIAFVPQGLPGTVTILMTVAVKRMGKINVMVKDLKAVETLGSVSLLATDKTGTLTQGKMTCASLWDGKSTHKLLENKQSVSQSIILALKRCLRVKKGADQKVLGDPTEVALYNFYNDAQRTEIDDNLNILCDIPFNSETKWQISVTEQDDVYKITLKGAAEKVFSICKEEHTNDMNKKFHEKYEEFAGEGQRVIALAEKTYTKSEFFRNDTEGTIFDIAEKEIKKEIAGFDFLGIIGIVIHQKKVLEMQ